ARDAGFELAIHPEDAFGVRFAAETRGNAAPRAVWNVEEEGVERDGLAAAQDDSPHQPVLPFHPTDGIEADRDIEALQRLPASRRKPSGLSVRQNGQTIRPGQHLHAEGGHRAAPADDAYSQPLYRWAVAVRAMPDAGAVEVPEPRD